MVCFAVDQKNGHLCLGNRVLGGAFIQPEAAENPCTQMEERAADGHRVVHVGTYFFDDGAGSGVGGICNDAGDIGGQIQTCGHQYRGCTHGKSGENNGDTLSKTGIEIFDPAQAVQPLLDAKTNGISFAVSVGSLVNDQGIKSHLPGESMATATVPVSMAAVAVHQNFQGCAIFQMVIAPIKLQTVKGFDGHRFKGVAFHDVGNAVDIIRNGVILVAFQRVIGGIMLVFGGEKCGLIGIPGNQKDYNDDEGSDCCKSHKKATFVNTDNYYTLLLGKIYCPGKTFFLTRTCIEV